MKKEQTRTPANEIDADVEAQQKQVIPFTREETDALFRYLEREPINKAYNLFTMVLNKLKANQEQS